MGCGASAPADAAATPAAKPAATPTTPAPDAYVPIAEQPAVVALPDIVAKPSTQTSLPDINKSSKKVQSKLDDEMNSVLNAEAGVELKEEQRKAGLYKVHPADPVCARVCVCGMSMA
jgi:hypothetical protein